MKKVAKIIGIFVALFLVGCSSVEILRQKPKTMGSLRFMSAPYEDVLTAVRESIHEVGLNPESEYAVDEKTTAILATNSATAFSWGDNIRVTVENTEPNKTAVWIISKRKHAMDSRGSEFSDTLFSSIEYKVNKIQPPAKAE